MLPAMKHLGRSLALVLGSIASVYAQAPTPPAAATPEPPRGLVLNDPAALDGYTLFSPLSSGISYLVDMQGRVVHRWETKLPIGASSYLLDNGHLLRTVRVEDTPHFFGGGLGGCIQELDWDGNVVWEFTLANEQRALHHDIQKMPNGHVLAIAWENVTRDEAIAMGRNPKAVSDKGWWPDEILEIEPQLPKSGKIVWEWHAKDHLIQDFDKTKSNYGSVADHAELLDINADNRDAPPLTKAEIEERKKREREMAALGYTGGKDDSEPAKVGEPPPPSSDWMHTNAVNYLAEQDLIVASSPHLSEIYVIDHSTSTDEARGHSGGHWKHGGDWLWRWGNPVNYGADTKTAQMLFGQHDPKWISTGTKGALAVTVFNNGDGRPEGHYSSIEELALPFDPAKGFLRQPGKPFGPADPTWSYTAPVKESVFSSFISGAQRLSNGNTLVCVGAEGRFFEVTRDSKLVWDYLNPFGGEIPASFGKAAGGSPQINPKAVFRATRIAKDAPALKGKKLEAL